MVDYIDYQDYIELIPPIEFDFNECLVYLNRSENECMHKVVDGALYKVIEIGANMVLLRASSGRNGLIISFPAGTNCDAERKHAAEYVWELFDLSRDLKPFYAAVNDDKVLKNMAYKYFGLRIIGMPDLFEALAWAVMGQQINLTFAYTLKRRFVESYGTSYTHNNDVYWLFPKPEVILNLNVADLMKLQFTSKKAEYIIGIARLLHSGELDKDSLIKLDYEEMKKRLIKIRGVGNWTADYVIMKCLRLTQAFPITDAGLHNALKAALGLKEKPDIQKIEAIASGWSGWEAYATFYLWRSLYAQL